MKIGGILESSSLILLRIIALDDKPGVAGRILKFFAHRKINLEYITESSTSEGNAVMAVCFREDYYHDVKKFITENQSSIDALKIVKTEEVSTLGIYGPHFREKHSVAALFCSILGQVGVNIYGISSSISSVCCIIKTDDLQKAKKALLYRFDLP